ncbi:MAG TPA: four helix bundle protein [Candidatus Absconditabacterales bacterium]|nr:four helix bundle protein [Candidatus Absconditabacterales bacterium]
MNIKFEKLLVRQKAKEITLNIQKELKPDDDWGFKSQVQRASISVIDYIAQGYEKWYDDAKVKLYLVAMGYNTKVINMISLGKDLGYLTPETANHILGECINLNKMVYSLVSKIKKKNEAEAPKVQ